jgi:hypothetical protein
MIKLALKIIISPKHDQFDFYVVIEDGEVVRCKLLIYSGLMTDFYIKDFFSKGKWKGTNEFIVKAKDEFEIRILVDQCTAELLNLSSYEKPPRFEMMKAKLSAADKGKAFKDFIHSMPPAMAAIITHVPN